MLSKGITLFVVFLISRVLSLGLLALAAYYCINGKTKSIIIVGLIFTLIMTFATTIHRWQIFGFCIFIFIIATVLTVFVKKTGIGIGWKSGQQILEK